jgi:hypothetical protein
VAFSLGGGGAGAGDVGEQAAVDEPADDEHHRARERRPDDGRA